MAQVFKRQYRDADRRIWEPPPGYRRQSNQEADNSSDHRKGMSELWGWGQTALCRPEPKHGNVATFRQLDRQRIALSLSHVILAQPRPEPARFGPHDGIFLRIVTWRAAEDFDRD